VWYSASYYLHFMSLVTVQISLCDFHIQASPISHFIIVVLSLSAVSVVLLWLLLRQQRFPADQKSDMSQ